MNIGLRLKELRAEKGLTQRQVADELHLAHSTIAQYETNKREPDAQTLCAFAKFFDVTVDDLLGMDD